MNLKSPKTQVPIGLTKLGFFFGFKKRVFATLTEGYSNRALHQPEQSRYKIVKVHNLSMTKRLTNFSRSIKTFFQHPLGSHQ